MDATKKLVLPLLKGDWLGAFPSPDYLQNWLQAVAQGPAEITVALDPELSLDEEQFKVRFEGLYDRIRTLKTEQRVATPQDKIKGQQKALFLDRDGVINVDHGYVGRPSQVELMPGIENTLLKAKNQGYKTVVVTNQSGIGRGYYSEHDFHLVMQKIAQRLEPFEVDPFAIYFSPYHESSSRPEYQQGQMYRKPRPGMLLRAMMELNLDAGQSVMIGDRSKDLMAAALAGVGRVILLGASAESEMRDFQNWLQPLQAHLPAEHPLQNLKTSIASHHNEIYL